MDYEKKYNEALERARKIHDEIVNNEVIGFPGQITDIFPELRESESEDERIRKKLYHTVMGTPNDSTWFDGTSKEAMLSWLEKQKEQKPAEWSEWDERIIESLISLIETIGEYYIPSVETRNGYVAWLKSLRPSWKPSEEQMSALNFTINYILSTNANPTVLRDLYNDLLKLKDQ